ncbi:retrovirus-related pol polyprotein from transposon TNT 1-94 [Tanacetum coccineum]
MVSCMTQLMDASGRTYHDFDSTLVGRYRVSLPALTKYQRKQAQYAVSREAQYDVFKIYYVKILEDIKCGPYSKKLQYAISKPLDMSPKIEDKDNFELKGQFLNELHTNNFSGSDHEDANEHIKKVLEIVDLFHILNITIYQVMLRAFLMSLTGAASRWLRNEPTGSITTWDGLKTKFMNKYCPPARTIKKMEEINNFQQEPYENLYQAWERFKELLIKCPQHYLTELQEVILFYNGLGIPTRQILDSRGAIPSKTAADAKVASQEMVEYSQKWHNGTCR